MLNIVYPTLPNMESIAWNMGSLSSHKGIIVVAPINISPDVRRQYKSLASPRCRPSLFIFRLQMLTY